MQMTIAACYVSAEGVVFGADSTATMFVPGPGPNPSGASHQFNCAQKVFEIGDNSTLGITMWGLGNLGDVSYRTLIAQFADMLVSQGAQSLSAVAGAWNQFFWQVYSAKFATVLQRVQHLLGQANRTPDEADELAFYVCTFSGGFCIGGYLRHERLPGAYVVEI
ncbi:MAG: hypothetical protein ACLQNE_24355 [Thermoguttaceae bacterium]